MAAAPRTQAEDCGVSCPGLVMQVISPTARAVAFGAAHACQLTGGEQNLLDSLGYYLYNSVILQDSNRL